MFTMCCLLLVAKITRPQHISYMIITRTASKIYLMFCPIDTEHFSISHNHRRHQRLSVEVALLRGWLQLQLLQKEQGCLLLLRQVVLLVVTVVVVAAVQGLVAGAASIVAALLLPAPVSPIEKRS